MYGDSYSINMDLNQHFSRYEDPLWDDCEKNNIFYHIKKRESGDKCFLDFIKNGKKIYTLDCSKLNKKQSKFIKTAKGMVFALKKFKEGIKNLSGIKKELKITL